MQSTSGQKDGHIHLFMLLGGRGGDADGGITSFYSTGAAKEYF